MKKIKRIIVKEVAETVFVLNREEAFWIRDALEGFGHKETARNIMGVSMNPNGEKNLKKLEHKIKKFYDSLNEAFEIKF